MIGTFESPELLAISLHCPLTAHSGHLANVDKGQGIWTQPSIVTLPHADRFKCIDNPMNQGSWANTDMHLATDMYVFCVIPSALCHQVV